MIGTIQLTPDELAQLVAGVMEYNGYQGETTLALYKGDELVGYDRVVIGFQAGGLKVRHQPEEEGTNVSSKVQEILTLRSIMYPEVPGVKPGSSGQSGSAAG